MLDLGSFVKSDDKKLEGLEIAFICTVIRKIERCLKCTWVNGRSKEL